MIKRLIKLILLIFLANGLFAQHTFEKTISQPEDQVINQIIEDNDGSYVMVGRLKNNETSLYNGYLIKTDSSGNLIQEKTISSNDTISSLFFNIHFFNNYYYVLGSEMTANLVISRLWYLKLNSNLEIVNEKFLNIPNGKWFSYMNSIIDSDTNFAITGYTTRWDTPVYYNSDVFLYQLNLNGDSINSKFYISDNPFQHSFDIIESQDNSKYYVFVSHFSNIYGTPGQRLVLDKNLDSLAIDSIPLEIYDYYSPIYINATDMLLCAKRSPFSTDGYALNVISINEQAELIDYNYFKIEGDMREYPSMQNSVSLNENNIYIGGTSNFDYSNPYWSTVDSWFHLIKINPDITPIWEYWYGGDAYYQLYSILATSDGGCIMVGNQYDYETQDQERDIYIAKVNTNGLIVWTQEIPIDKQLTTVYPNPGTNLLNIKTENKDLGFELINLNGQVIIKQMVNNNTNAINTELLKPGIYFYKLSNKRGETTETGKWIKN